MTETATPSLTPVDDENGALGAVQESLEVEIVLASLASDTPVTVTIGGRNPSQSTAGEILAAIRMPQPSYSRFDKDC